MIGAVRQYNNFMIEADFMTLVAEVIQKQVPAEQQAHFQERLGWLQMIAQAMQNT